MRLKGKIALVTGAASGIGRAAARRFAEEGAQVIGSDVDAAGLETLSKEITQAGGTVRAVACDVGEEAQIDALFADIRGREARLDVLYNNAGIAGAPAGLANQPKGNWERVFRINLDGTVACARAAVDLMGRGSSIINQSSIAALVGGGPPGVGPVIAYSASKGAVVSTTRAIAYEFGHRGIRCNAILPGSIATAMTDPLLESQVYTEGVKASTPLGRFGDPEEVAAVALFLASDDASFVSGEAIVVDGGHVVAQGKVFPEMAL